jgi:hypothetical protein
MRALLKQLNQAYFWDTDPSLLKDEKSKRLIVERVFNFGNLKEIKLVKSYYGIDQVSDILINLNYIDPKTVNFISLLLNIPKNKFKCFTKKQLTNKHWNY